MNKNFLYQPLALAADLANGIFAVLLVGWWYGVDPVWWHFLVGMVFAMFPDIDAIPELLRRGRVGAHKGYEHDHRTFLHYPIISVPIGLVVWWLFGYWGLLWLIALVLHLINDLYGTGWGIPLLYPITNRRYKINIPLRSPNHEPYTGPIGSWTPRELEVAIVTEGNPNWVIDTYATVNWISLTEYTLFLLALILMIVSLIH